MNESTSAVSINSNGIGRNGNEKTNSGNLDYFSSEGSQLPGIPSEIGEQVCLGKVGVQVYPGMVGQQVFPGKMCHLSIRLMDSSVLKKEFNENQSLSDVKRWLQKHDIIPNTPQDDEIISNYIQIGYLEKFRYAFFSPATRHTFTESEELLRLKDIGLANRVSLILRPDYDPSLQTEQVETDIKHTWRLATSRMYNILQALYLFFDYGVDEAQKDLQDFTESLDHKDYGAPHFLGTAPSTGSLVNITAAPRPLESPIGRADTRRELIFLNSGSRAGTPSVQMTETSVAENDL